MGTPRYPNRFPIGLFFMGITDSHEEQMTQSHHITQLSASAGKMLFWDFYPIMDQQIIIQINVGLITCSYRQTVISCTSWSASSVHY